jgi:hypothetical protein
MAELVVRVGVVLRRTQQADMAARACDRILLCVLAELLRVKVRQYYNCF